MSEQPLTRYWLVPATGFANAHMEPATDGEWVRYADAARAGVPGDEGLVLVRVGTGGVFPDGTTNTPAIDFDAPALAASPAPGGLDVERLARAIRTAETRSQMEAQQLGAVPPDSGPLPDWYRAYAADVAREYAASPDSERPA